MVRIFANVIFFSADPEQRHLFYFIFWRASERIFFFSFAPLPHMINGRPLRMGWQFCTFYLYNIFFILFFGEPPNALYFF